MKPDYPNGHRRVASLGLGYSRKFNCSHRARGVVYAGPSSGCPMIFDFRTCQIKLLVDHGEVCIAATELN